jgi:hypothetical protein
MSVVARVSLFVILSLGSWYLMEAVHEFGHVFAACISGGKVQRVVLSPFTISRTDVSPNPHPLFVAWAGPAIGAFLPLAIAALARRAGTLSRRLALFFAGFCLIANGVYIGVGSFDAAGDSGDMLRHGSPQWLLILFGCACSIMGLWIWHRLTKRRITSPPAANAV